MRMNRLVSFVEALLVSGAFITGWSAIPAAANVLNQPNGTLKIRVEYHLAKKEILTNKNITVTVGNNSIELSGTVPTLFKRIEAGELTRKLADGRTVLNDLKLSAPAVSDSAIDAEVMHRIQTQVPYTVFDWAEAHSKKGVVTLRGWVNNPQYITSYQRQAERVAGVKKVVNRLKYIFQYKHLAWRAVNLIYRHGDMFPGASLTFNPPVHVIAVDGMLILEGKMDSAPFAAELANRVRYHTDAIRVYNEIRTPA